MHDLDVALGVPPNVMGIGPAYAIPRLLEVTGLQKEEIGIFEINEAFASQSLYCVKKLGLDPKTVNPKGGAIAFGHPLGIGWRAFYCRVHWGAANRHTAAGNEKIEKEIRGHLDVHGNRHGRSGID